CRSLAISRAASPPRYFPLKLNMRFWWSTTTPTIKRAKSWQTLAVVIPVVFGTSSSRRRASFMPLMHVFASLTETSVVFTDDGVTIEPTWLRDLTAPLRNRDCSGVGGRVLPERSLAIGCWNQGKTCVMNRQPLSIMQYLTNGSKGSISAIGGSTKRALRCDNERLRRTPFVFPECYFAYYGVSSCGLCEG